MWNKNIWQKDINEDGILHYRIKRKTSARPLDTGFCNYNMIDVVKQRVLAGLWRIGSVALVIVSVAPMASAQLTFYIFRKPPGLNQPIQVTNFFGSPHGLRFPEDLHRIWHR
jgi:hypothetical protein